MLDDIIKDRKAKLEQLRFSGIDPYPASVRRTKKIGEVLDDFNKLAKAKAKVYIAGRIIGLRDQGNLIFADIRDDSGKMQAVLKKDNLKNYKDLKNGLDSGDFISVGGAVFKTQKGEKSIEVKEATIAAKSLRSLPSEWFGLTDHETRLRKRYLDLLLNPELKELFIKKSNFWRNTREFLMQNGFLEVETPVLEPIPGGADARPFITHHHALDIDLYLRISPELHLKRLLVGGYEKVFEIGRIFRNEGIDDEHLQDYTQMEFYWAYADFESLLAFTEKMAKYIIKKTFGTLTTTWKGQKINWAKKWPRVDYFSLLNKEWGVHAEKLTIPELYKLAEKLKVKVEPDLGRGRLLDYLYKKTIRPKLIQPQFLINPPVDVEPLAKRLFDDETRAQRMQILAMGTELGKGFSELNDPIDQRWRFEEQMRLRAKGDEEAQMADPDFVEALEYGMPPAVGFGMSERLFAMLVDKSVREMVFFPAMRSKE